MFLKISTNDYFDILLFPKWILRIIIVDTLCKPWLVVIILEDNIYEYSHLIGKEHFFDIKFLHNDSILFHFSFDTLTEVFKHGFWDSLLLETVSIFLQGSGMWVSELDSLFQLSLQQENYFFHWKGLRNSLHQTR